jgi:hypothetical protein
MGLMCFAGKLNCSAFKTEAIVIGLQVIFFDYKHIAIEKKPIVIDTGRNVAEQKCFGVEKKPFAILSRFNVFGCKPVVVWHNPIVFI